MRPSKDELYIRMAYLVSERATCARRRVGCVLVDQQGIILATGYNGVAAGRPHCNEGHPCQGANLPSGQGLDQCQALHAEQNALIHLREPQRVYTAYVTTSPCIFCIKMLMGTSCRRLVFAEEYPHPDARDWWTASGREWIKHDNCPFTYREGGEPPPIKHKVIGVCRHCGAPAHTEDPNGFVSCFPCAISEASW